MICASLVLLQIMFAVHRFAQGATAPAALRVADCRSAAMLIKSALRIYLSISYVMKSITSISHLRWLFSPPFGAASRQRRYKKMAPKAPYLPSGTVLYTSRGQSPQPVREASAGPGQNPGSPGPKGPAAGSTLAAKPRQPTGILESTAQTPVPIPTAPRGA